MKGFVMDQVLKVMMESARSAGHLMLEAGKEQIGVKTKSSFRDLVTKYDVMVQALVVRQLCTAFPEARFISEEGDGLQSGDEIIRSIEAVGEGTGEESEETRGDLQIGQGCEKSVAGDLVFVIDPIDGTANFSHHYQHSCISIGCMCGGEPAIGVVYDPFLDEMFSAIRGKGAFLNGERLVIPKHSLSESLVLFGSSPYYMELADETFRDVREIFGRCQDIRRTGSAALDLCYVAAGRAGLYFECMLSVWDYAAGSLIVREAGGACTSMKGEPLICNKPVKSSVIAGGAEIIKESGLVRKA